MAAAGRQPVTDGSEIVGFCRLRAAVAMGGFMAGIGRCVENRFRRCAGDEPVGEVYAIQPSDESVVEVHRKLQVQVCIHPGRDGESLMHIKRAIIAAHIAQNRLAKHRLGGVIGISKPAVSSQPRRVESGVGVGLPHAHRRLIRSLVIAPGIRVGDQGDISLSLKSCGKDEGNTSQKTKYRLHASCYDTIAAKMQSFRG